MEKIISPNREREQIQSIIDRRMLAVYGRDEQLIMSFYSPQVTTFDFSPPLQNNGLAAVKVRLEKWLASYAGHIHQEVSDVHVEVSGNMAYSYCLTRTYGTSVNGQEQDMWYRTTT
ncbi:MAG: nuclear transport factor 2 family protein [Mucilaginibacter sp.]|nr:nuclear transport factor 2 family protein [Mucilaginibacter sp.]